MIHIIAGVSASLQAGHTIALSGLIARPAIARRHFPALTKDHRVVADGFRIVRPTVSQGLQELSGDRLLILLEMIR